MGVNQSNLITSQCRRLYSLNVSTKLLSQCCWRR